MNAKQKLASLVNEAEQLLARQKSGQFTDADAARALEIAQERDKLRKTVDAAENAAKALAQFSAPVQSNWDPDHDEQDAPALKGAQKSQQFAATHAPKFTANAVKAFHAADQIVGGTTKALSQTGSVVSQFDQEIYEDPQNAGSLYGAVTHFRADGVNGGSYLVQESRTNNAAAVKNGDLKPISSYGLKQKNWRLATVAHLSEPMQRQWFEDFNNLEAFIGSEMAYGLDLAIADLILHGTVDEDGETFTGIMNTTGVGQTEYTTSPLRTIRKAITAQQITGATPTSVVLHPSAWEEIESTLTTEGAYLMQGAPQSAVTPQLFGLPVLLANGLGEDEAIVGDLSSVVVFDKGNLLFSWSEAGQVNTGTAEAPENVELFRANKVIFRSEIRLGLALRSTAHLRVASLADGAGV